MGKAELWDQAPPVTGGGSPMKGVDENFLMLASCKPLPLEHPPMSSWEGKLHGLLCVSLKCPLGLTARTNTSLGAQGQVWSG